MSESMCWCAVVSGSEFSVSNVGVFFTFDFFNCFLQSLNFSIFLYKQLGVRHFYLLMLMFQLAHFLPLLLQRLKLPFTLSVILNHLLMLYFLFKVILYEIQLRNLRFQFGKRIEGFRLGHRCRWILLFPE